MLQKLKIAGLAFLCLGGISFGNKALASHVKGGEITWTCVDGKYQFTIVVYRDCSGTATIATNGQSLNSAGITANIPGYPSKSFPMTLVSVTDITPQCGFLGVGPQPLSGCAVPNTAGSGTAGSTERFIFRTPVIDFTGVPAPPPGGYTFFYTPACCRNAPGNVNCSSMTLRAKMFPYTPPGSPIAKSLSICYDSSPRFAESPVPIFVNTNKLYTYNQNAEDLDNDSLSFAFDFPLNGGINNNCGFTGGYTVNNPIPGNPVLDPKTGELAFNPNLTGKWVTCIRVDAWRCGKKVASIWRDFQVEIINKPADYKENDPPVITPPFGPDGFEKTFYTGETIKFKIHSKDTNLSVINMPQDIQVMFAGAQFGKNWTDTTQGCPFPPCAAVNKQEDLQGPSPEVFLNYGDTLGYGYKYTAEGDIWFYWPTACENLLGKECGEQANTYRFVFRARDNACPTPAQITKTLSIRLLPPPELPSPRVRCVAAQPNGDVVLSWGKPSGVEVSFRRYQVFYSDKPTSGFTLLKKLDNIWDTTFTHVGANAHSGKPIYYFVQSVSTCLDIISPAKDTVRLMVPKATYLGTSGEVRVTWNPIRNPNLPSAPGPYKIYRQYPIGSAWQYLGTSTTEEYKDPLSGVCQDSALYKIELDDQGGCTSVSAQAKAYIFGLEPEITFKDNCADRRIEFKAVVNNATPPVTITWSGEDNLSGTGPNFTHTYSKNGTFSVNAQVKDGKNCINNVPLQVVVYGPVETQFSYDTACSGNLTTLTPKVSGGASPLKYHWQDQFGWTDSSQTAIQRVFPNWGRISVDLTVTDERGCQGLVHHSVYVDPCTGESVVQMPDAFSPNKDGYNDDFKAYYLNLDKFTLVVFNRWGEMVFESNNPEDGWDGMHKGKKSAAGVYVWTVSATGLDGKSHQLHGTVTLLN